MLYPFILVLLSFFSAHSSANNDNSDDYSEGREPLRTGIWPSAFDDYQILPGSQSPNTKYGFIYPKRSVVEQTGSRKLWLVSLAPFKVLCELPINNAILATAHGSYSVSWAPNSSLAVFTVGKKWGPEFVFALPVSKDGAGPPIDLEAEVRKLAQASYDADKAPRFNDYIDFIFEDEDYIRDTSGRPVDEKTSWTPNRQNEVMINCICTNDPKHLEATLWEGIFQGTWDIAQGRFLQHHFEQIPQDTASVLAFNLRLTFSLTNKLSPCTFLRL